MSRWHFAPGELEDGFEIETCLPVEEPASPSGRIGYRELPPGLHAFAIHEGAYDTMGARACFEAISNWIEERGYEPAGPPRDIVLVGPTETDDPAAYRREVVYPVTLAR